MTRIFFQPGNNGTSGWTKVGALIKLITISDQVLVGGSTTGSTDKFLVKNKVSVINAEGADSVLLGLSAESSSVVALKADKFGSASYPDLALFAGGSEKVRVTTGGLVGIGVTSPLAQIHTTITADGSVAVFEKASGPKIQLDIYTAYIGFKTGSAIPIRFYIQNNLALTIGSDRVITASNGMAVEGALTVAGDITVSDGGISLADVVTVNATAGGGVTLNVTAGPTLAMEYDESNGWMQLGTTTNHPMRFVVNGATKLFIDAAGQVIVGGRTTVEGAYALQVDNGISVYSGNLNVRVGNIIAQLGAVEALKGLFGVTGGGSLTVDCALEIQSTSGGFLLPRMTTTQKLAIAHTDGMMVYDTTLNAVCVYYAGWHTLTMS